MTYAAVADRMGNDPLHATGTRSCLDGIRIPLPRACQRSAFIMFESESALTGRALGPFTPKSERPRGPWRDEGPCCGRCALSMLEGSDRSGVQRGLRVSSRIRPTQP